MKILNKKDNKMIIEAEITEEIANAIRRNISEIPTLAIDEVEIIKNDSALYDETIAHRLGLIPLRMERGMDEDTKIDLKLISDKEGYVYSGEIKGKVKPVFDKIPITFLDKGQEIELIGKARIGKGSEHSKFNPGLIFYHNLVEVNITKDCPKQIAEVCPRKVFKLENGKVSVQNVHNCDMCEICIEEAKKIRKPESIVIKPTNKLIIYIEGFGQMDTEDIFLKSIKELKKDLVELGKKL